MNYNGKMQSKMMVRGFNAPVLGFFARLANPTILDYTPK